MLAKWPVTVKYRDNRFELLLLATQGDAPNSLVGNSMKAVNLSAFNVADIFSDSDIQQYIRQHSALFSEGPGTLPCASVKLHVREGAKPSFVNLCSIPFG